MIPAFDLNKQYEGMTKSEIKKMILKKSFNSLNKPFVNNIIAYNFRCGDNNIYLPEFSNRKISPIIPTLKSEVAFDQKKYEPTFKKIHDIIVNGDKPINGGIEECRGGISARYKVDIQNEERPEEPGYFWMSWLMSHVPIFIIPNDTAIHYDDEDANIFGAYFPNTPFAQPIILICIDRIEKYCESAKDLSVEELLICTIIHEFAHAVMDIGWDVKEDSKTQYVVYSYREETADKKYKEDEEAWANGVMLQYLKRYGDEDMFKHVLAFTKSQPEGYRDGETYMNLAENEKVATRRTWYDWYLKKCAKQDVK